MIIQKQYKYMEYDHMPSFVNKATENQVLN